MADLNKEKIEQFIYYFAQQQASWKEVVGEFGPRIEGIPKVKALFENPNFPECAKVYGNDYFNSCKQQLTAISNELPLKPQQPTINRFKM